MTFIQFDICHQIGPLWMLYSITLTFIFKVTFSCYTFVTKIVQASDCPMQICIDLHSPRRGVALVSFSSTRMSAGRRLSPLPTCRRLSLPPCNFPACIVKFWQIGGSDRYFVGLITFVYQYIIFIGVNNMVKLYNRLGTYENHFLFYKYTYLSLF